jgi:hypothetical protein
MGSPPPGASWNLNGKIDPDRIRTPPQLRRTVVDTELTPSEPGEPSPLPLRDDAQLEFGRFSGLRSGISRRVFLRRGSMVAGVAAAFATMPGLSAVLTAGEADGPEVGGAATESSEAAIGASEPVVAHVVDASTGEINLYQGTQMVTARSPALAQALARLSVPK